MSIVIPTPTPTAPRSRPMQGLLNRAEKNPRSILHDGRARKAGFCLPFFDLCDALAYEQPERARELTDVAVELGNRSGDRHLANRGLGVRVNAAIALAQWDRARSDLESHERAAADCCASCLSDHLHRRADLALEYRQTSEAMLLLRQARSGPAASQAGAAAGRLLNLRGTGRLFGGENGAAVEDAGTSLLIMPLDAPRLFFRDAIGLMACFLKGGDRRLDERALDYVLAFKQRLRGVVGWQLIRTRLSWLEGVIYARLGDNRRAAARLESARFGLAKELGIPLVGRPRHRLAAGDDAAKEAPEFTERGHREMIALTADLAQLSSQRRESAAIGAILDTAARRLTLDARLRKTLEQTRKAVQPLPWNTLDYLEELRAAVLVPIPGLLAERYVSRSRGAAERRRRPRSATPLCYSAAASMASGQPEHSSAWSGDRTG